MKRARAFMDRNGFFVLLAVCIAAIIGSGMWAYAMRQRDAGGEGIETDASGGYAQRLEQAQAYRMVAPLKGSVQCAFSDAIWLNTLGCWGAHEAVDYAAGKGETVAAAKEGTVDAVYRDGEWGGIVEISHGNGLVTRYGALSWPVAVAVGESVTAGKEIGMVGVAAREAADPPHLHFEVWLNGVAVNPATYIMD